MVIWMERADERGERGTRSGESKARDRGEPQGDRRRRRRGADCHKFKQQLTFRVGAGSHRTAVHVSVSRFSGRTKSACGVPCGSVKKRCAAKETETERYRHKGRRSTIHRSEVTG